MEEKKHQQNIEPLDESDLSQELDHELFAKERERLTLLNKKVHEGGEAELPLEDPTDLEDEPSHHD